MSKFTYNSKKMAEEEVEKRRCQSRTYTEPLQTHMTNVQLFLEEFYSTDLFERGLEFKAELEKFSDTVGEHYKFLVPESVSFDEFFSRYYYRCNSANIMRDWSTVQHGCLNKSRCPIPSPSPSHSPINNTDIPNEEFGGTAFVGNRRRSMTDSVRIPPSPVPRQQAQRQGSMSSSMTRLPSIRNLSLRIPQSPMSTTKVQRPSIGGSTFFMNKDRHLPPFPGEDQRTARNELALKLLEEAKGRPVDDHCM